MSILFEEDRIGEKTCLAYAFVDGCSSLSGLLEWGMKGDGASGCYFTQGDCERDCVPASTPVPTPRPTPVPTPAPTPAPTMGGLGWHCESNDWCARIKGVSAQHCRFWVPYIPPDLGSTAQVQRSSQVRFVNGVNYRTTGLSCGFVESSSYRNGVRGRNYIVYWEGCGKHECHGDEMRYSDRDHHWCDLYIDNQVAITGRDYGGTGTYCNEGCG